MFLPALSESIPVVGAVVPGTATIPGIAALVPGGGVQLCRFSSRRCRAPS